MLNQVVLVGRLTNEPELTEIEYDKKMANITLAVPRPYKNKEGEYETDFIKCTIWGNIAQSTTEYCKKGDLIGVRGRIETTKDEKDGKIKRFTNIIADKVTFLSTKSRSEQEHEDR